MAQTHQSLTHHRRKITKHRYNTQLQSQHRKQARHTEPSNYFTQQVKFIASLRTAHSNANSTSSSTSSYYTATQSLHMAESNTKEFIQYMNLEKVKSIDMPRYELHASLRTYLKEFELQANFVGIDNMDICTVQLGRFMPTVIKNWLPTLPATVRQNWANVTEQMLLQFGRPAEEEYRKFKTNLKRCQQPKQESIKLHSAKWTHLLSLLPDKHITDSQQISLFTQSLHDRGLRATLTAYVELAQVKTVKEVITKAIDFEYKARLNDNPEDHEHFTGAPKTSHMDDPMEVDDVNRYHKDKNTKKQFPNGNKSSNSRPYKRSPPDTVPRLYNKQGKPVCGHCFGDHRNYECPTQSSSVH